MSAENGAYYSPDRIGARVVELMRKVELQGASLHSLRHSHASSVLSQSVPIAVVAERQRQAIPAHSRAAAKVWNDSMANVIAATPKLEFRAC